MAKKQVVRSFKTTPLIEQHLELLSGQFKMSKSMVVKTAIQQLADKSITWAEGSG